MTLDEQAATSEVVNVTPTLLAQSVRHRIFLYLGILITLLAFGAPHGGLIEIPVSFLLKNKLHLEANELAKFRLLSSIPVYLSFVFGFIRDTWSPLGMRDRGYMLVFGSLSSILYLVFALMPVSYEGLLIAIVLLTTSFLFVSSAQNGLASVLGQQHLMSGQVSAVWNIFASLPVIAALLIGGTLSDTLEGQKADEAVRILFLCGASLMAAVAVYAIWRPQSVFDNIANELGPAAQPWNDLKRLARHWPIYPALVIWLLWNFAPGSTTPLQYHLQNNLHASDAEWGQWNAIFAASFIPTFMLFGVLCQRYALRTLLWWGTLVAVPPMMTGHASHQIGLDGDIWLTPMPDRTLTGKERENIAATSMLDKTSLAVDPNIFTARQVALIKRAASYQEVERIFVHPAIKKALCEAAGNDRTWLAKVRPMWGHHYHFHIRISCPNEGCQAQAPVPGDDGCGKEVQQWLKVIEASLKPAPSPRKEAAKPTKPKPPITMADLPSACQAVLDSPETKTVAGTPIDRRSPAAND